MCHKLDDDVELDLALAELLRCGEQEADELTQSFGTPILNVMTDTRPGQQAACNPNRRLDIQSKDISIGPVFNVT